MTFGHLCARPYGMALLQVTDKGRERTRVLPAGTLMLVLGAEPGRNLRVRVPSDLDSGFDNGLVFEGDVWLFANGERVNSIRDYQIKKRLYTAINGGEDDEL